MTDIAIQQERNIAKDYILDAWRLKGIPEEDLASQVALDLVFERERTAEWKKNYEHLLKNYEALKSKEKVTA